MPDSSDADHVRRAALLRESKWAWWSVYPGLAWVAWLHAGLLTRHRRYFAFAALWAIPFFIFMAFVIEFELNPDGPPVPIEFMAVFMYFGGMIHVFRERKKYKLRLADVPALLAADMPVAEPAVPFAVPDGAVAVTPPPIEKPSDCVAELFPPKPASPRPPRGDGATQEREVLLLTDKLRIDANENWAAASVIPIIPCIEEPDAADEVTLPWKKNAFSQWLVPGLRLLVERNHYSAITVFHDHFYVSQATHVTLFFILPLPGFARHVARHQRADILRLVAAPRMGEKAAYVPIYGSQHNRRTSEETFRLYVRAGSSDGERTSTPEGGTAVKYVFRVADDAAWGGGRAISIQEALTQLHHLVPAEKRATIPANAKPNKKEAKDLRLRMRNSRPDPR